MYFEYISRKEISIIFGFDRLNFSRHSNIVCEYQRNFKKSTKASIVNKCIFDWKMSSDPPYKVYSFSLSVYIYIYIET